MKKTKKKVIALGAVILAALITFSLCSKNKKPDDTLVKSISQEFEDDDTVLKVRGYLEISEQLNKMGKQHSISDKEISKQNSENMKLASMAELQQKIQELEKLLKEQKDLTDKQREELIEKISFLSLQEQLVNEFLYKSYYEVADILEKALQEYIGEKYGIIDTQNIDPSSDYFRYNDNTYSVFFDSTAVTGMMHLNNTTAYGDPNPNDNNLYNEDRNEILDESLDYAKKITIKVKTEDLYSKMCAKKIK